MTRDVRTLECKLTDSELLVLAREFAQAQENLESAEATKAAVSAEMSENVKKARIKVQEISRTVSKGAIYRMVECRVEFNRKTKKAEIIRTDTGELVEVRPMTEKELQRPLLSEAE